MSMCPPWIDGLVFVCVERLAEACARLELQRRCKIDSPTAAMAAVCALLISGTFAQEPKSFVVEESQGDTFSVRAEWAPEDGTWGGVVRSMDGEG